MKNKIISITALIIIGVGLYGCAVEPVSVSRDYEQFFFAGSPQALFESSDFKELTNIGYVVGYSESRKNPLWSAYRLRAMTNPPTPGKRPGNFKTDKRTDAKVKHKDYTHSGFDRGHMAPNWAIATRYGRDAQIETFFMSNICPQEPNLNQGMWRCLEMIIAKAYANQFGDIWVLVGPIFDDDIQTLTSGVEIPDEFYMIMVIADDEEIQMQAFIMEQEVTGRHSLVNYITNVDTIEDKTGLDFFVDLPDEQEEELESATPAEAWKVEDHFLLDLSSDCIPVSN